MTLFDIAKKNVTGNFKSYLLYFVSMIFSVVIYYTFVSLQYSEEIQATMQSSQVMSSVFMGASIVLILFVAVFIWYSNSFFTRKRKKEVGLYSLLGMRKRTIGKMLFYENLIMGAVGVAIGVVFGTLLSKLFTMIFLKLLDSAINVSFSISLQAILNTVIVFAVLILFTSVQAYRLIYRFKLIELFQAEKEGDQAPKASVMVASLAVLLLAFSYWLVFQPMTTNEQMGRNMLLFIVALIAGTYFLFHSAIVWLLRASQSNKSRYYRGMNVIATSQLLFRIKGNTRTLTMIALLSAITLSAVGVGYSMYYSNENNADDAAPFSYSYISDGGALDKQVEQILAADTEHPVTKNFAIPVIRLKANTAALAYNPSNFPPDDTPLKLIAASKYNEVSGAIGRKGRAQLTDNQAAAIRPRYATDLTSSDYAGRSVTIKAPQADKDVSLVQFLESNVLRWTFPDVTIVVSDRLFDEIAGQVPPDIYHVYQVEDQQTAKASSEQLTGLATEENQMSSYYAVYRDGLEDAALNIFVLGFLGLVFLAATGSIIYFKQLTEARSDQGRYDILRKIGVSRKDIRISVAKQTFFVFALPLVIGILHSSMILKALSSINLINGSLTTPIMTSMAVYVVIYLIYYVLTVQSFNKIVNK
ncbi:ABC transporter permease [Paenibacillus sepulcri]|uniref:ABC transporter permease n=1 Tax=Paenibacillus sepulcri TaxID=359917 RepID=A0ABS7C1N7_9BACL|nr:ABC transporter permease [Paenibacillus sepulcri]